MSGQSAAALRHHLEEIDAKTAALAAERQNVVEKLQRITYRVLKLPVEIMSEIFLLSSLDRIKIGEHQDTGPFILASVCKHWREIALGLCQLWTRISILCLDPRPVQRILSLCVSRAGNAVNLNVEFYGFDATFALLAPLAERLSELELHSVRIRQWNSIRQRLPRLQRLSIYCPFDEPLGREGLRVVFETAPMLREVHLSGPVSNNPCDLISLPWAQLTSLSLFSIKPDWCIQILSKTPALETLNLELFGVSLLSSTLPKLSLERVHTLIVDCTPNPSDAGPRRHHLIDWLTLPALTHLTFRHREPYVDVFPQLLSRSKCGATLRSVTIDTNDSYGAVTRILDAAQHLDRLTVTGLGWEELEELMFFLAPGDGESNSDTESEASIILLDGPPVAPAKSPQPIRHIQHVRLAMALGPIPYPSIASFVSRSQNISLKSFELCIPHNKPDPTTAAHRKPEVEAAAVKKIRHIAAAPDRPNVSIKFGDVDVLSNSKLGV
ncbi:hypothetical protein MIND_00419700 [Mycena indigotica]|uniref:F-box domain-containing protein n=1 Tax=Mycena indigotica TaxID=2126181 RepID=A0A8H6W634_9AGAR|nr:uncharacterized protein MIND_00419700 [Mycena indigotica]KAF7306287.1 hypothetical protein MIND_00419700 [Mycena indigotica]